MLARVGAFGEALILSEHLLEASFLPDQLGVVVDRGRIGDSHAAAQVRFEISLTNHNEESLFQDLLSAPQSWNLALNSFYSVCWLYLEALNLNQKPYQLFLTRFGALVRQYMEAYWSNAAVYVLAWTHLYQRTILVTCPPH